MSSNKPKTLTLSKDKLFLGVIGGFTEYFGGDVTLWRVLFALFVIVSGFFPGVVFYVVAWLIMSASQSE